MTDTSSSSTRRSVLPGSASWLHLGIGLVLLLLVCAGLLWWAWHKTLTTVAETSCADRSPPQSGYLEVRAQLDGLVNMPFVGGLARAQADAADAMCLDVYLRGCRALRDDALAALPLDGQHEIAESSWWQHLDQDAASLHCSTWEAWVGDMNRRGIPVTEGCAICQPAPESSH